MTLNSKLALAYVQFQYTDEFNRQIASYLEHRWIADGKFSSLINDPSAASLQFTFEDWVLNLTDSNLVGVTTYRSYEKSGSKIAIGWNDEVLNSAFRYVTAVFGQEPEEPFSYSGNSGVRRKSYVSILGYASEIASPLNNPQAYAGQPLIQEPAAIHGLSANRVTIFAASGTNEVRGYIPVYGIENASQVAKGVLKLTGTLDDATNQFSGEISDTLNGYVGTFRGGLYGPNREEMALLFQFSRPLDGGVTYSGEMLAKR